MFNFKKFNEQLKNEDEQITILRKGLKTLITTTHIIANQVETNLDSFLSTLNLDVLNAKFGTIVEFLGSGVFGAVYKLSTENILKITFDFFEAPFVYKYCKNINTPHFVKVDDVFKINFGKTSAYLIIRKPIKIISNPSDYNIEIEKSMDAMYNIDPNWRGTHYGNFGIQNGEVVLYDGFSKNIKLSDDNIPKINIVK